MKHNKLFLLLIPFLLQSCGGGGGDLKATGDISGLLTNNRVLGPIKDFATALGKPINTEGNVLPTDVQPFMAPDYTSCTTFLKGSTLSDKEFKIQYDCKDIPDAGATYTRQGTFYRKLEDDTNLSLGFSYDYDVYSYNTTSVGTYYEETYKGTHTNTKTATKISYTSDYAISTKSDNYKPIELDWSWRRKSSQVFIPDDMSQPMENGKMEIDGFYKMGGKLGPDSNQRSTEANLTLEVKSKDLVYDRTGCNYFFKSGSIFFKDGSQNEFETRYNCSSVTYYYNGKEFEDY